MHSSCVCVSAPLQTGTMSLLPDDLGLNTGLVPSGPRLERQSREEREGEETDRAMSDHAGCPQLGEQHWATIPVPKP